MLNLPEFICELESQTITTDQIDNLLSLLTKMNSSKTAVDPCLYYREILKVLPEYVPKVQYDVHEMLMYLFATLFTDDNTGHVFRIHYKVQN